MIHVFESENYSIDILQAIHLLFVGLPFLFFRCDVSAMTATTPISFSDSSFTSELGVATGAGAILIGLCLVGCDVISEAVREQIYTET